MGANIYGDTGYGKRKKVLATEKLLKLLFVSR